jgi:glycosyltransferase involved in cell wall biosynthesis
MIHERFPESFPASDKTSQAKAGAVANADHIICISKQTQRDLIELLGVDPNKTSVVYLGFMQSNVQPIEGEVIAGRPYLLYVGNRGGYKNFERVLRAIAASSILKSQYRLICFGGGPFAKAEQTLTESLGFEEGDVIRFLGR